MEKCILVTYGSKRGATAEIAERIGEVLRKKGLRAEVMPAGQVRNLAPYSAIVIGSSVYIGLWHKAAARFLKRNESHLAKLPVWLFYSGPTGEGDPMELTQGWFYPESLRPVIERICPYNIMCFGGKIVERELNPFEKFIIRKVNAASGDYRNWDAVTAWAREIGLGAAHKTI